MFGTISVLAGMIASHQARKIYLETLPEALAKKLQAEDAQEAKERLIHNRALEVARAGTPLNFWGNK